MSINYFNNPENTNENGILCFGGDLRVETLIAAYKNGIFPWPISGLPLTWFCPPKRALIDFNKFYLPKSLTKFYKKINFKYTIDQNFSDVIQACAETKRPHQPGTWITPEILEAYNNLHAHGVAHSVEVWDHENKLVGGIYGVCVEGCFAAESMFYKVDNASKCALIYLVEFLKKKGAQWIDIQVMTPHMLKLGAEEIDRKDFLVLLKNTQKKERVLF